MTNGLTGDKLYRIYRHNLSTEIEQIGKMCGWHGLRSKVGHERGANNGTAKWTKETEQMTNQINANATELQLQTVPARIHTFLLKKIKECVDMENKEREDGERELTVADFIRVAAAERVGRILKEEVSYLPPVIRGRGGSPVAQAAKMAGISRQEFMERSAELVASQALGFKTQDQMIDSLMRGSQMPKPGVRSTSKSGEHRIQDEHSQRRAHAR